MNESIDQIAYCGLPPLPGELVTRWTLDPVLIAVMAALVLVHAMLLARASGASRRWGSFSLAWLAIGVAFVSPLCALSVALFSARVAQHMLLVLVAAPFLVLSAGDIAHRALAAWPRMSGRTGATASVVLLALLMWFWHAPGPYDATLRSPLVYWLMHLSLLSGAVLFWSAILSLRSSAMAVIGATVATAGQMSLLGALITFAARPLYGAHADTSWAWSLTPLQDQQLGGIVMWAPGGIVFTIFALLAIWRALPLAEST